MLVWYGVGRLCDLEILDIKHVGESPKGKSDLFYFAWGQLVKPVNDLLLYGGWGVFCEHFPGFCKFNGNHPSILGNP